MNEKRGRSLAVWTIAAIAAVLLSTFFADIWLAVDYRLAANCSLIAAAVTVSSFTARYAFWSKWKTNRIGSIFLVVCVGLSVFLVQAAWATWVDTDYPYRQQIRFGIYCAMSMVYVPMIVSLVREQQRDRRERDEAAASVDI